MNFQLKYHGIPFTYQPSMPTEAVKEVLSIGLSRPETVLVLAEWLRTYLDTEVTESLPGIYKNVVLAEQEQIDWCSLAEEFIDNVSSDTRCGVTVVGET
ncbi:MAG: hypothetical protein AB4050_14835 [Synechococcus sp.]